MERMASSHGIGLHGDVVHVVNMLMPLVFLVSILVRVNKVRLIPDLLGKSGVNYKIDASVISSKCL